MHKNTGVKSRRKNPLGKLRLHGKTVLKKDIKEIVSVDVH